MARKYISFIGSFDELYNHGFVRITRTCYFKPPERFKTNYTLIKVDIDKKFYLERHSVWHDDILEIDYTPSRIIPRIQDLFDKGLAVEKLDCIEQGD